MPNRVQSLIGQAIRNERTRKGLSQEDLAFKCGLHRTYIGSVERGERNISIVNLVKIAEALGVTAKDLMGEAKL